MMMGGFAGREGVHIDAYSYLLETLGMPEATYKEFLLYEEMKDKQDYIKKFSDSRTYLGKGEENLTTEDKDSIAAGIALFSRIYGRNAIVFNICDAFNLSFKWIYERGWAQIVTWSIVDETQHTEGMIELFKVFVEGKQNWRSTHKAI